MSCEKGKLEYAKEGDYYVFYDGEEKLFETKSVAILFDVVEGENGDSLYCLLKHGIVDFVKPTFHKLSGVFEGSLAMFESDKITVEELNQMLDHSGYIPNEFIDMLKAKRS